MRAHWGCLLDHVPYGRVTAHSTVVHAGEHWDVAVHVVVDLHNAFIVVQAMEPTDILLQRALPRNRHRQLIMHWRMSALLKEDLGVSRYQRYH